VKNEGSGDALFDFIVLELGDLDNFEDIRGALDEAHTRMMNAERDIRIVQAALLQEFLKSF